MRIRNFQILTLVLLCHSCASPNRLTPETISVKQAIRKTLLAKSMCIDKTSSLRRCNIIYWPPNRINLGTTIIVNNQSFVRDSEGAWKASMKLRVIEPPLIVALRSLESKGEFHALSGTDSFAVRTFQDKEKYVGKLYVTASDPPTVMRLELYRESSKAIAIDNSISRLNSAPVITIPSA